MFTHPRERFGIPEHRYDGGMGRGSGGSFIKNNKELYFLVTTPFSHLKIMYKRYYMKLEWHGKRINAMHTNNRMSAKTEWG